MAVLLGAGALLVAVADAVRLATSHPRPTVRHYAIPAYRSAPHGHATLVGRGAARYRSIGAAPLDSLPFAPNPADRAPRHGEIPSLYDDGLDCSTGCRPYGADIGWPLKPFHQQHPLRAGLNELRPGSLHVGLDIQARDGQAVYAVQPGIARILEAVGPNARVEVGNYIYWHVAPSVIEGQWVIPFKTVLGRVLPHYGHIAFSEVDARGDYVNPLRPGGSVLEPYANHAPPVIGTPSIAAGGQVIVSAFSPQTFVRWTTYVTPVLAPAAIAYRLYDSRGLALTPLEWAFRGTHLLPWLDRSLIYVPGAQAPGFSCFATRPMCVPHWTYRVAGGFAPPLPPTLAPGRYRLTIYAWDWADNATALDTTVTMRATGWKPIGRFPPSLFHMPGYYTQSELTAPATVPVSPERRLVPRLGSSESAAGAVPYTPSTPSAASPQSAPTTPSIPSATSAPETATSPRGPAVSSAPSSPTGSGGASVPSSAQPG